MQVSTDIEPNVETIMISDMNMQSASMGGGGDAFDASISEDNAIKMSSEQLDDSIEGGEPMYETDEPVKNKWKKYFPAALISSALLLGSPQIFAYGSRVIPPLFASYVTALKVNPWRTKALTGGITALLGDCMCQTIERISGNSNGKWDFFRTSRFFGYGSLIHGPMMHFSFKYGLPTFSRFFAPGTSYWDIAKQLMYMQTVCTGSVIILFFLFMAIVQREPLLGEMRIKAFPTYKKHLRFMSWPLLFGMVALPYDLKAPFVSSLQIPWNSYLSYMKNCRPTDEVVCE